MGWGPQSAWLSRVGLIVSWWTLLPSALAVAMPSWVALELVLVRSEKMTLVPSGD
jgi:hypothetical protein